MCLSSLLALTVALGCVEGFRQAGEADLGPGSLAPGGSRDFDIHRHPHLLFRPGPEAGARQPDYRPYHLLYSIRVPPVQARLLSLGSSLEEAGRDLYANEWLVFQRVTLPLLAPSILAGALLAFASSLDDFIISMMLANAGQTTLPVYIYGMLRFGVTPEVNAISTLLLVSSTIIVTVAFAGLQYRQGRTAALREA